MLKLAAKAATIPVESAMIMILRWGGMMRNAMRAE
jgi:hypothetical protein